MIMGDKTTIIKTAKVSSIVLLENSESIGDGLGLIVGLCKIVGIGVGLDVGEEVGIGVGEDVGVGVGDCAIPSARDEYAAPVGLTVKFAIFCDIIGFNML